MNCQLFLVLPSGDEWTIIIVVAMFILIPALLMQILKEVKKGNQSKKK